MPRSPLTELYQKVSALAEQIHTMPEDERNFLFDLLMPEPEPATKKSTKAPTKERKIEKCEACNLTRRAARHRDVNDSNYHEFVKPEKKSARASSLKEKIQGTASGGKSSGDNDLPTRAGRCSDCGAPADDNVHHLINNENYHPFQPSTTAPPATRLSPRSVVPSTSESEGVRGVSSSTQNSETGTETVSSAGAGD